MKGFYIYMLLLLGWCLGACSSTECYYMDSITGDDSNSGTSPSRAWKTLDRLNQQVFKPGDKILFKSGTEYIGSFSPKGNGTEEAPIVVDKFGKGENPILNGDGQELYTVLLNGNVHWILSNLEIMNKGKVPAPGRKGVWIQVAKDADAYHIELRKLTIREVYGDMEGQIPGGGVYLASERDSQTADVLDVILDSCYIYHCRPWSVYVEGSHNALRMKDNFIR